MRKTLWSVIMASVFLAAAAAQDAGAPPAAPAVSDAAVGRLSVMRGDVSTQRGGAGDWTAGAVNEPLLTGDSLATTAGSRGEVQLDYADLLRLDENSQATLANLTHSQLQVQVGQGLVDYVVLSGAEAASEIDTPNLAVHPQGAGVFRIQVNSNSESVVTVRSGDCQISTPQGSTSLHAGQTITVEGTDEPEYQIADAPARDGWDQWNQERDARVEAVNGGANRYYTGASDLDGYGHWMYVAGYGQVWAPEVAPGWAPYSAGRWVYEPAWGWTWVSVEPWGWAPYHYGRWFYYGTSWVWWPGPVMASPMYRPVWAPAYVSFLGVGGGIGVGVGMGFGSVGWVALGPADVFRPWWGVGIGVGVVGPLAPVMVGRVEYSNVRLMAVNPVIARAVITVPADRFGQGPVVRESVTMDQIRRAQVMRGALPMAHTGESLRVSDRVVNPAALPRAAVAPQAHFFGTRPPAAAANRAVAARAAEPGGAVRPGFHSFGSGGSAGTASPRAEAGTATGRSAAASNNSARGGNSNWRSFQPANSKAGAKAGEKKPEKKEPPMDKDGHDGGRF